MNSDHDVAKGIKFQRWFYNTLRVIVKGIYCALTCFSYELYKPKSDHFLLLSNHNTDLDCFSNVIGTASHMKFVASERVIQGFGGWIVKTLVNPIPRRKGAPTDDVIDLIRENLINGISVGLYAEGLKSWDGETSFISRKTALLVRGTGAGLVTYRIEGGYFRSPHWAGTKRKGPMHGKVIHEYPHEQLAQMTDDEIYNAICTDLYTNAYTYQREHLYKYKGEKLAEGAELTCYICPRCRQIGHIHSENDMLFCDCGLKLRMNEYGFFEGEDIPYDNILDWSHWQKKWLNENAEELKQRTDNPLIVSTNVRISKNGEVMSEKADIKIYGDRIDITENDELLASLEMTNITKLGAFLRSSISMTCDGVFYSIYSTTPISGYQYFGLWRVLSGKIYE